MSYIQGKKVLHRIYIGGQGNYTSLKPAVDWFNASATSDVELLLDSGAFSISDTITVNNATYDLAIRGLGINQTKLNAATGLTNKPMFDIKTNCDINRIAFDGSTLENYGTLNTENCINFTQDGGVYCELTDFTMDNFYYGIKDTAGIDMFLFNFIISDSTKGIEINHTGTGRIDAETGNFENCAIGIDLVSATSGQFVLNNLYFFNPADGIGLKYDGTAYSYGTLSSMFNCLHNDIGTFISGFDFTNSRDSNIVMRNNVGIEDKNAHAKINLIDNSTATTVTTAGTYYKAAFTNTSSYKCKTTIADNKMTYEPDNRRDGVMWISGNVQANNVNRNVTVGIKKNNTGAIISPMTVRTITASQPYSFSLVAYLENINKDDYFELFLTSSTNGDEIIVQDLTWYFESR